MRDVHVIAGVLMPVPLVPRLRGPLAGRRCGPTSADWRAGPAPTAAGCCHAGRDASERVGKFNAGQKANAAFVAGMIPVMLVPPGSIMRWYDPLRVDIAYRTGATFVHDWTAIATWVVVAGHIVFALSDRASLRGMVTGRVARPGPRTATPGGRPRWRRRGRHAGRWCRGRCR